jgi:hypothetical protein
MASPGVPANPCWIDDRLVPLLTGLAETVGRLAGRQDALGILKPSGEGAMAARDALTGSGTADLDEWIGRLVTRWLPERAPLWHDSGDRPAHFGLTTADRLELLRALIESINSGICELDRQFERERMKLRLAGIPLNRRQLGMINLLAGEFPKKLTSTKWARITRCSPDTALRDITDLVAQGVLVRDGAGGRSTTYSLSAG